MTHHFLDQTSGVRLLMFWLALTSQLAAETYRVGPDERFKLIEDVPFVSLKAGDIVEIVYRPEAYHAKFAVDVRGTARAPVVIRGLPGPKGELPMLDGEDAATPSGLDFWAEERGVIKIGGTSLAQDVRPAYVVIENLDIRHARPGFVFHSDRGAKEYTSPASAVYVEEGDHITIRNCALHDCGNGLFVTPDSSEILVEGCRIYDNGIEGSVYEHNSYTETAGITFRFNWLGPLRKGCGGNNLKDRSAGLTICYNRIEGGNRQLDLVEADGGGHLLDDPRYDTAYVYGNLLIEHEGPDNHQIIHFGGDVRGPETFRKGPLHLYHNTIVSLRKHSTCLMRLTTNQQSAEVRNNVIYIPAGGKTLCLLDENGQLRLQRNWISAGWRPSSEPLLGKIVPLDNIEGESPGFRDFRRADFKLDLKSPARDQTTAGDRVLPLPVEFEPPNLTGAARRQEVGPADLGAFEGPAAP